MIRREKRHMLLLEVLIAFTLIVVTIIPLIYPHTAILISQKKFIHKIELDHYVNQIHAKMIEDLYTNDINWSDIVSDREVKIDTPKKLPFEGTYKFTLNRRKPPEESEKNIYLINLDYKFISKLDKDEVLFHYDLFIVRDLTPEGNVQE